MIAFGFPLKKSLKTQKKGVKYLFKPFEITSLEFHFSFQNIFDFTIRRRFQFDKVTAHIEKLYLSSQNLRALKKFEEIREPKEFINWSFPQNSFKSKSKPYKISFKKFVPVKLDFNLKNVYFSSKNLDLDIKNLFLSSQSNKKELLQKIKITKINIKTKDHEFLDLSLSTDFSITNNLRISFKELKLNYLKSYFDFSGDLGIKDDKLFLFDYKNWKSQVFFHLSDFFSFRTSSVRPFRDESCLYPSFLDNESE